MPNSKVPEKELCERFGVSRTPLREALKVLAFEGLVVLNHNRGAMVKPLTMSDLDEAFPIYSRLEALAGELACEHARQSDIEELRRLHDKMFAHLKESDVQSVFAVNEQIHSRIQEAAGNRNLIQLLRYVSSRVRRARLTLSYGKAGLASAVKDHEHIMEALERRDAPYLSKAIRDHVENTLRLMKEVVGRPAAGRSRSRRIASRGCARAGLIGIFRQLFVLDTIAGRFRCA